MYVRICQEVLKIPLKNEIPAAGKYEEKKRGVTPRFFYGICSFTRNSLRNLR